MFDPIWLFPILLMLMGILLSISGLGYTIQKCTQRIVEAIDRNTADKPPRFIAKGEGDHES